MVNSCLFCVFVFSTGDVSASEGLGAVVSFFATIVSFLAAIILALLVISIYPVSKMIKEKKVKKYNHGRAESEPLIDDESETMDR